MGGCASKPRDLNAVLQTPPSEASAIPNKSQGEGEGEPKSETVGQTLKENNDGGESERKEVEEPLVDVSETNQEAAKSSGDSPTAETKDVVTELVSELEEKVEPVVEEKEEEKAEAGEVTVEAAKEEKKVEEPVEKQHGEIIKVEEAPSKEDKDDAPLVSV